MRDDERYKPGYRALAEAYSDAYLTAMRSLGHTITGDAINVTQEYLEAHDVTTGVQAANLANFDAARARRDSSPVPGRKFDSNKPDWSLLPLKAAEEIVKVLTFGAKKYERDNWMQVPDGENRYLAAALRHLAAHQAGEVNDPESNLSHLAHAGCCILFLLYKQLSTKN